MIEAIFFIIILIISVVIHEVSHGYVAYLLGDPTAKLQGRLTLNPLVHIDPVGSILVPALLFWWGGLVFGWAKPVPYNPHQLGGGRWGPAYVAAAGPVANILLAVIFGLVLRLSTTLQILNTAAAAFVSMIVLLNIMLAIFNLIPIVPLDGSKILFALLPYRWRHVEEWLSRYQFLLLIVLILIIVRLDFISIIVQWLFNLFTGLS